MKRFFIIVLLLALGIFAFAAGLPETVDTKSADQGGTEAMFKKLESEASSPQAYVISAGSMINYQHAISLNLLEPYALQAKRFKSPLKVVTFY